MHQVCSKCGVHERKSKSSWCRPCINAAQRVRYAKHVVCQKMCNECGISYVHNCVKGGGKCAECRRKYNNYRYRNNVNGTRDKVIAQNARDAEKKRIRLIERKYGLTQADFDRLRDSQRGKCAICEWFTEKLVVDHCHATGRIRGLLCGKCNSGIGLLQDDPRILRAALNYLIQLRVVPERKEG